MPPVEGSAHPPYATVLSKNRLRIHSALQTVSSSADDQIRHIPGLVDTFIQLLRNLRHTTTSLALACKPPITLSAADQQSERFADELCRLFDCVTVLGGGDSILLEEWTTGVKDIAAQGLRFFDALEKDGEASEPYVLYTGLVWDAIDKVLADLSVNETQAFLKRWRADSALVKDAWQEFKGAPDGEDDFFDTPPLSSKERATMELMKPSLALFQILHATLPRYFDNVVSPRRLLSLSAQFVEAYDDLVCALEPTHDADTIEEAIASLDGAADAIARECERLDSCREFVAKWRAKRSEQCGDAC